MRRTTAAVILAPAAATLAFSLLSIGAPMLGLPMEARPGPTADTLGFYMLIGLPVAYLGSIVFGIPLFLWLRSRDRLSPAPVLAAGGFVGGLTVLAIPLVFGVAFRGTAVIGELGSELLLATCLGAVAGLVGGGVFSLVGRLSSGAQLES
jgi:hypothetical protein